MTLKQLLEKRAELAARIKALADKVNAEERDFNTEERAEWEAVNKEYNDLLPQIEIAQRAELVADQQRELAGDRRIGRDDVDGRDNNQGGSDGVEEAPSEEVRALALQAWCRWQLGHDITDQQRGACRRVRLNPAQRHLIIPTLSTMDLRALQQRFRSTHPSRQQDLLYEERALTIGNPTAGGYIIPPATLIRMLEVNMLAFGGMRQVAETITTSSGERMVWPTADDTTNTGAQLGESTSIGASTDPSFGQVAWDAYKFSSKPVLVPFELLEDSAFDLVSLLGAMLGERLGRITNTKFTTGTGAATPKGLVTAATLGVTAASQTAIAADELFNLVHSINPAYRMGAGWMMHDNVILHLRKLKDGNGQYLWQSGMNSGAPDRLIDYPVAINQDMASSVATTAKTALFGQLSKYKIRRVNQIRLYRLEERYRDTDQDGFVAFVREDGNLLDAGTAPVKYLQQA